MRLIRLLVALIPLSLVGTSGFADAPRAPALKGGLPVSIAAYGRQNPLCAEWTNGCVVCTSVQGQGRCSTPGIACTPAGLTCTRKTTP